MSCPKCSDTGIIKKSSSEFVGFCDCVVGKEKQSSLLYYKLNTANIYQRYWNNDIKDLQMQPQPAHGRFIKKIRELAETLPTMQDKGYTMVVYGDTGVGKTMAASVLMKHLILNHRIECYYTSMPEMMANILSENASTDEMSFLGKITEIPMLVIDDIGLTHIHKDYPIVTIEALLRSRLSSNKTTILILKDGSFLERAYSFISKLVPTANIYSVTGVNGWTV